MKQSIYYNCLLWNHFTFSAITPLNHLFQVPNIPTHTQVYIYIRPAESYHQIIITYMRNLYRRSAPTFPLYDKSIVYRFQDTEHESLCDGVFIQIMT